METCEITGKIALVTGGALGIGLNCVKELLRAGVLGITIADINEGDGKKAVEELTQEFGPKVIFVKTDVTKVGEFEEAFKKTVAIWKGIDILINNAGILNDKQWDLEISINCNSVVQGTLLGIQYMRKDRGGKGGVIVNVASILGLQEAASCPIYVATKHFVVGFSRSLGTSYHYNQTGIKILTMCPGVTETILVAKGRTTCLETLSPNIGLHLVKEFEALPRQQTANVGCGMITLISKGKNGSVWVAEGNEPIYEVTIPDRRTLRKV